MAAVVELVIGQKSEYAAGLRGFRENVTIIFHDCDKIGKEEIKSLIEMFAEYADGWCVSRTEDTNNAIKDSYDAGKTEACDNCHFLYDEKNL